MIYNDEGELLEFNEAFDYQLLQKVLPRLTGNDPKTEKALKVLFSSAQDMSGMNQV
ncbi:hypothetical protein Q0N12_10340 [Rossellomorea marisflavi]|uniref:hypothetical protein n=1 Tax=Rossellomorea marisflavi TaxID=189381 RepID=UPI003459D047